MTYDAAGNQTYDGVGTHYYDTENRMTKALQGSSNNYYFYDANGKRVRRILNGSQTWNGQETWFVYGFEGELVAEYAYNQVSAPLPSSPQKEYGYRGGKMLVVWDGDKSGDERLKWLVADHLGSTRMEADKSGRLNDDAGTSGVLEGIRRHDYLPFGEELVARTGAQRSGVGYEPPASNVKQKFGSKERDNETGLDYFLARYHSSLQGRFTRPDEFSGGPRELYTFTARAAKNPTFYADIRIPQSLNKYTYCINNPLRYIDPDGHDWRIVDGTNEEGKKIRSYVWDANYNYKKGDKNGAPANTYYLDTRGRVIKLWGNNSADPKKVQTHGWQVVEPAFGSARLNPGSGAAPTSYVNYGDARAALVKAGYEKFWDPHWDHWGGTDFAQRKQGPSLHISLFPSVYILGVAKLDAPLAHMDVHQDNHSPVGDKLNHMIYDFLGVEPGPTVDVDRIQYPATKPQ
jgi:RHS repeat-associated protein